MLGGRHQHHHAQALSRALAVLAVLAGCLAGSVGVFASHQQKVASEGTVHSIEVEGWATQFPVGGTVLRYDKQLPTGMRETSIIPGTDDPAVDLHPALDIDPATGTPVVVWTRNEGDGFDLFVSRHDGDEWSPPRRLYPGASSQ